MRHFNDYLGNNPLVYVRRLMRHFNYKCPPIPIEEISDHLGLTIEEGAPPSEQASPELHKTLSTVSCWLERDKKRIQVYRWAARTRKRLGIGHENTHFIIPYHEGINPFCPGIDDPATRKYTEHEAFVGGAAMLLYPKLFIPDVLSLNQITIAGIQKLAERYDASLEATAIWFAQTHPGICAIVRAEVLKKDANPSPPEDEAFLGFALPPKSRKTKRDPVWLPASGRFREEKQYSMRVKYAVVSNRFPKWISPGTVIPDTCLTHKVQKTQKAEEGEIGAWELGSSSLMRYRADCVPLAGDGDSVLALISLPDEQPELNIGPPYEWWAQ